MLAAATIVALLLLSQQVAPAQAEMFLSFGAVELPWVTRLVLDGWFPAGIAILATFLLMMSLALRRLSLSRKRGLIVAAFVVAFLGAVATLIGLYLPIFAVAGAIQ